MESGTGDAPVAVEIRARSIINRVPGDDPMMRWTLNPYRGCAHACVYCFARRTHEYLDLDSGRDFDTRIIWLLGVEPPDFSRGEETPFSFPAKGSQTS